MMEREGGSIGGHLARISLDDEEVLRLVWFRPTDQTNLEPIELFYVVSTITGLNFIEFRLVLRIRFGRFGWSKGSQSTTDGITPCNGRNHTSCDIKRG